MKAALENLRAVIDGLLTRLRDGISARQRPQGVDWRDRAFGMLQRFDRLTLRERAAIGLAALILPIVAWDSVLMAPLYTRERAALGQLAELSAESAGTTGADGVLTQIDSVAKRERELKARFRLRQREILDRAAGLVEPQQMGLLLENLIDARSGVRLVRLANLPVEEIQAPVDPQSVPSVLDDAGDGADPQPPDAQPGPPARPAVAYVHGMEIVVEGGFADIHRYLTALEAQQWHFLWRKVEVDASAYPLVRAQLSVATLSLDRNWLRL